MSRFPASTEIVAIRVLPEEKDALRRIAAKANVSVTHLVRESVLKLIDDVRLKEMT